MADNNRNRQDSFRQQYDWNDDHNRQRNYGDEPNYTNTENRGRRDSGRSSSMNSGDGGWQSRYERQMNTNREGDFENDYNREGERQSGDQNWGTGRGLSSGYSDFGGDYSRRGSRDLYDRGHVGMNRRDYENRENRIGGANYDRYGDHGRYEDQRGYGGSYDSNYGRPNYGRSDSGSSWGRSDYRTRGYEEGDRNRNYGRGEGDERSWWDRTTDEVSSWFGDEDAERRRERDRQRAQYRGKGPKNYSRSDERIKEDINDRLSDDPFIDASDIEVTVAKGEVTLTGTVGHRSSKRRAEDIAESVSGVKQVENRLRVGQSAGSQGSGLSGMNDPSGSSTGSSASGGAESGTGNTTSQSSSPIPGAEKGRKATSY